MSSDPSPTNNTKYDLERAARLDRQTERERRYTLYAGLVFLTGSVIAFTTAFFQTVQGREALHVAVGAIAFIFGYLMLGGRRSGTIPQEDFHLFDRKYLSRQDEIGQYGALRKLSGVPGFFRNLGIIGLPLATVAITVLFCALALTCYLINAANRSQVVPDSFPTAVLELSKLTLGAFIGSFVGKAQRALAPDDITTLPNPPAGGSPSQTPTTPNTTTGAAAVKAAPPATEQGGAATADYGEAAADYAGPEDSSNAKTG
jgi:hypothetical protein